jgi:hypothetical protein
MTSLKDQLRRCASSRGRCGVLHVRLAPQASRALTLAFERRHPKKMADGDIIARQAYEEKKLGFNSNFMGWQTA